MTNMSKNPCTVYLCVYENPWSMTHHKIVTSKGKQVFDAWDLSECPEDATLYRDMFNGEDYISALKQGMAIAQHGYDSIEVIVKEFDNLDDYESFLTE